MRSGGIPERLADRLVGAWYAARLTPLTLLLTPLSLVFGVATMLRRLAYRRRWLRAGRLPVPVIVVGNLCVGGAGKTPLVAALARDLADRGWHPGIVSRGYGGAAARERRPPVLVRAAADPAAVGDEPVLLARRGHRVAVAADRLAAGRALLAADPDCDVIIADDGLQHYRLARSAEVVVIDAARGLGNGWLLPAGPLREPRRRLATVAAVVLNRLEGAPGDPRFRGALTMTLDAGWLRRVDGRAPPAAPREFTGRRVHAVAGIGNPQRFFALLRSLGIVPVEHPFPDHHPFARADLAFDDDLPVLMTEKDAVKCSAFADERCWYLPVDARLDPTLVPRLEEKLRGSQAA